MMFCHKICSAFPRLAIRTPGALWIALAIALSSALAAGDDKASDNGVGAAAALTMQQVESARRTFFQSIYKLGMDADAGEKLKAAVQQKIVIVDQACALTDVQKEKLELPGLGDSKHLLERVEKMMPQLELIKLDPEKIRGVFFEGQRLARALRPGLVEAGSSLFIKALDTTLTAEQLDRFRPFRMVLRAGGQILPRRIGTEDGLAIDLSESKVEDDDISTLIQIPKMNTLILARTNVTDAGVAQLNKLTDTLQLLTLDETQVTDAGLAHLEGLTKLQYLSVIKTRVTDAGLSHLQPLTALQNLMLQETAVGDAGMVHLKGLEGLEQLNLRKTRVTDAGLAHLKGLSNLKLVLLGAHVTDTGIAEMRQALPSASIVK